ncbi:MAG: hypothetical protein LBU07_06330 [Coriobacteriales bacterium]|jgi:hypothetical protein|nr:hypothetical protein [Coriobacteriales bacterium]
MAEAKRELFSEEAIERVFSPEKLDGYLKVVQPNAWIAVLALALFVVGATVWGFAGTYSQTVLAKGLVHADGTAVGYLPVEDMPPDTLAGCAVRVALPDGVILEGVVAEVSASPLSQAEVSNEQPDAYTAYVLATSPYEYRVTIDVALPGAMAGTEATGAASAATSTSAVGVPVTSASDTAATGAGVLADFTIVVREERLISLLFG